MSQVSTPIGTEPQIVAAEPTTGMEPSLPSGTTQQMTVLDLYRGESSDTTRKELRRVGGYCGWSLVGPWEVVASRFHGGRTITRHRSLLAAIRSRRSHDCRECQCGGCYIQLAADAR